MKEEIKEKKTKNMEIKYEFPRKKGISHFLEVRRRGNKSYGSNGLVLTHNRHQKHDTPKVRHRVYANMNMFVLFLAISFERQE